MDLILMLVDLVNVVLLGKRFKSLLVLQQELVAHLTISWETYAVHFVKKGILQTQVPALMIVVGLMKLIFPKPNQSAVLIVDLTKKMVFGVAVLVLILSRTTTVVPQAMKYLLVQLVVVNPNCILMVFLDSLVALGLFFIQVNVVLVLMLK
jgi:hypothetical protein